MAKKNKEVKQSFAKDEAKPQQPLHEQVNPKAKSIPFDPVDTTIKYRYVCPRCTGVAFKSFVKNVGDTDKRCDACGLILPALEEKNYIDL